MAAWQAWQHGKHGSLLRHSCKMIYKTCPPERQMEPKFFRNIKNFLIFWELLIGTQS